MFPLFGVYAVAPGLQCGVPGGVGDVGDYDGPRRARGWGRGMRGVRLSVRRAAPRRGGEAFIKLALSQHRAIIAE